MGSILNRVTELGGREKRSDMEEEEERVSRLKIRVARK